MYHAGNQVRSSKGKNEQIHPTQNLGQIQGKLPDQELCDPAIGHYQKNPQKKKFLTAKIRHLDSQEVQEKKNHSTHATNNIYNRTDYLTKRSLRDDTQDQNAQNSRLL